jgi:integrase
MKKLTDVALRALLKNPPRERQDVQDAATPGLKLRIGPGAATWSLIYRVKGEGGVSARGFKKRGKRHRLTLGEYPEVTLEAARATAQGYLDQAARGVDPGLALERAATAGGLTVEELGKKFRTDYIELKKLRSGAKYLNSIDTHINPSVGSKLADLLTRADARELVKKVSIKVPRGPGGKDRPRGGTEAARTVVGVFRKMLNWGIKEELLTREDNPFEGMEENLPKMRRRERVLSVEESQIAWVAAGDLGYPFGPAYRQLMLSACRESEWGEAIRDWISIPAALSVIPADDYKSDHVHVVPLVPVAVNILQEVFTQHPTGSGPYIFSGTDGRRPISGWQKAQERLMRAMSALTGEKTKDFNPHDIRRTVATRAAEKLGYEGERLVKRVLGQGEDKKDVTLIYNRYGYVKEMRAVLTELAEDLLRYDPTQRLTGAGNQIVAPPGDIWVPSKAA